MFYLKLFCFVLLALTAGITKTFLIFLETYLLCKCHHVPLQQKYIPNKMDQLMGKVCFFSVAHKPVNALISFVCFILIFITLSIVWEIGLLLEQYHNEHCAASDETRFWYWTPAISVHLSA